MTANVGRADVVCKWLEDGGGACEPPIHSITRRSRDDDNTVTCHQGEWQQVNHASCSTRSYSWRNVAQGTSRDGAPRCCEYAEFQGKVLTVRVVVKDSGIDEGRTETWWKDCAKEKEKEKGNNKNRRKQHKNAAKDHGELQRQPQAQSQKDDLLAWDRDNVIQQIHLCICICRYQLYHNDVGSQEDVKETNRRKCQGKLVNRQA